MNKAARYTALLMLCLCAINSHAQITPKVPTLGEEIPFSHNPYKAPSQPQFNTYTPVAIPQPSVTSQPGMLNFSQPYANPHSPSVATGNAELVREMLEYEAYENDKRQRSEAATILTERGFLSLEAEEGTASYYSAFEELAQDA